MAYTTLLLPPKAAQRGFAEQLEQRKRSQSTRTTTTPSLSERVTKLAEPKPVVAEPELPSFKPTVNPAVTKEHFRELHKRDEEEMAARQARLRARQQRMQERAQRGRFHADRPKKAVPTPEESDRTEC